MFLWKAANKPVVAVKKNPFSDVKEGGTFYNAIMWAYQKGITRGYPDGTFRPLDTVTRGEYIAFQYRAAGKPRVSLTNNPFKDVNSSHTFYNAIMWAAEHKITLGRNGNFMPANNCVRGQVVTFLYRANHLND